MRGWLVASHFVTDEEYLDLLLRFERAATRQGIELVRKTNVELAPLLGQDGPLPNSPDFVLFWCKDIQLARHLEARGLKLFNSAEAIEASDDKAATVCALERTGITQPRTVMVPRSDTSTTWGSTGFAKATAAALGLPVVVKGTRGSFGSEVFLAHDVDELVALLDMFAGNQLICQQFIAESFGRDARVQVVGGRVVGAIERFSETGDFRANIDNGASYRPHSLTVEEERIAVEACDALGLDFAGVDLLFGLNGPVLCEVNSNAHSIPEMQECCNVNVADEIMTHIARELSA
ncbi:MAG: RimK family alpha-L-glutamate ligase [Atopobiaceae bacterium]|nr:RimK family alpha-L-glutamate ligase [Atopobiaceae bacterium]